MKDVIVTGYKITTELPTGQHPPELEKQLPDLARQSQDRKNKLIIGKLEKLIGKYPNVPVLKNFLTSALHVKGLHRKARELNDQILQEHPDYLHAKLNEADRLLLEEEFDKVPEILGTQMELKALYPERDEFHISEVKAFLNTAIRYFLFTENLEQARVRMDMYKEIIGNDAFVRDMDEALSHMQFLINLERLTDTKNLIKPEVGDKELPEQITQPPKLHHPEIKALYKFGFDLPEKELNQILALPRQTLIADLLAVVQDGLNRFEHFADDNPDDEELDFVLHAFFILGELKATEALPAIANFLEYDLEFQDFWLGDHLTESLWRIMYQFGQEQPELLEELMLNPSINVYARSAFAKGLQQVVLHHPEKREAVLQLFKRVFHTFLQADISDNIIDSEFIGFAVIDAVQGGLKELLPEIKQLYDKGYVPENLAGTYADIEADFEKKDPETWKSEILPLPEFYQDILRTWQFPNNDPQMPANPAIKEFAFNEPAGNEPKFLPGIKTGRNDPCPCGSGKKFKKCCGS